LDCLLDASQIRAMQLERRDWVISDGRPSQGSFAEMLPTQSNGAGRWPPIHKPFSAYPINAYGI
jgi:hypothetical protein